MRSLFLALVLLSFTHYAFAGNSKCTEQDSIAAEQESDLNDWRSVYKSFKRYSQCDGGAVTEVYSEAIAQLLTSGWSSIGELNTLMSKDKKFGHFVIHHVDELMEYEQALRMYENVRSHCPAAEKQLCKLIENRLDELPKGTEAVKP
jgi:hypothetical protein